MAMTTGNVNRVRVVSGDIVISEKDGTTTTNKKSSLTDAIALLKSTDSDVDARQQVHAALRQVGFTGTLGNFGG